jgi:hypothetical protein
LVARILETVRTWVFSTAKQGDQKVQVHLTPDDTAALVEQGGVESPTWIEADLQTMFSDCVVTTQKVIHSGGHPALAVTVDWSVPDPVSTFVNGSPTSAGLLNTAMLAEEGIEEGEDTDEPVAKRLKFEDEAGT